MKKLYTLILLIQALTINAQDGTLDVAFGMNGKIDFTSFVYLSDFKMDSDGKIIILGGTTNDILIYRLNSDGTLDTTFDTDGIKTIDLGTNFNVGSSLAIDASNNIFIASSYYGKILKLSAVNGEFDTSFGNNGIATILTDYDKYIKVAVDHDNKVVVASFQFNTSINFLYKNLVHRLNSDGSIDATFNSGNPVQYIYGFSEFVYVNGLEIQNDNKILLSGTENGNVPLSNALVRFNNNGSLDTTFNAFPTGVDTDSNLSNINYSNNGLFATAANSSVSVWTTCRLIKYNTNGTKDNTFDTDGIVDISFNSDYYNYPFGIQTQPDSKIIIAANSRLESTSALTNVSVARINPDGSLDSTFGTNGMTSIPISYSNFGFRTYCGINNSNGKLYVLSFSSATATSLYRFNTGVLLGNNQTTIVKKPMFYPNPTSSILNIQTNEIIESVKVTDISGRTTSITDFSGNRIDVSGLSDGFYFIEIKCEEEIYTKKFVKK